MQTTHTLWCELAHAANLRALFERAQSASQRYDEPARQERAALAADPVAAQLLPCLGFTLETRRDPRGMVVYEGWVRNYHLAEYLTRCANALAALIESLRQLDGNIVQRISTERAETVCEDARGSWYPYMGPAPEAVHAPVHLALALARLPGPAWQLRADGTALERVLPPWPLRYPPTPQPLKTELKTGLMADTVCWAILPAGTLDNPGPVAEIIYLSLVGPHKKLKAVWATVMDKKRELLRLPKTMVELVAARRVEGKGVYQTFWPDGPLAKSGMAHLVIEHRSEKRPRAGESFLHITGVEGTPDLTRFFQQLDIASSFPMEAGWAEMLWNEGRAAKLIVGLPSYGCNAYWVRAAEPAWAGIVARCAGATAAATVETFGALKTVLVEGAAPVASEEDAPAA